MKWGVTEGAWEHTRRVLGRLRGPRPGPTLVAVGGLHGNETAGILALQRVLASLWSRKAHLSGEFIALRGNRRALAQGRRFVDWDLNRGWTAEGVSAIRGSHTRRPAEARSGGSEGRERQELLKVLEQTIAEARGEVFFLDLHSTSGPGAPFTTIADSPSSRDFARSIPVPLILGLGDVLRGTLAAFVAGLGVPAAVFEGGQHGAPGTIASTEAALWLGLSGAGILRGKLFSEVRLAAERLEEATWGLPPILEMRYREQVEPGDEFRMLPGFRSFQPVSVGEILGRDRGGPVASPGEGRILLPLYQAQGEDGFFLVREIRSEGE
jgi:succinylglutamate desuccinylase